MRQLLKEAVAADFPGYTEIAVSFPDQWEVVRKLRPDDGPLYIAGLPRWRERSDSERFYRGCINKTPHVGELANLRSIKRIEAR
jgi:hypothetical protein